MEQHFVTLIFIILVAGLIGGFVNFLRIDGKKFDIKRLLKSLLFGVTASLLVPVLFRLISSDLILTSEHNPSDYLVIFGFCLVAGIFSNTFIDNLGKRVLNLQEDLNKTQKDVDTLEAEPETIGTSYRNFGYKIPEDEFNVLSTFKESKFIYRAISRIAFDLNKDKETIRKCLKNLEKNDLVKSVDKLQGKKWMITDKGREYYNYYLYEVGEESYHPDPF